MDSWAYQLAPAPSQGREDYIRDLAESPFRLVVMDYSATGGPEGELSPWEVAGIKASGKVVLAYVSIGEAEDYRWYWRPEWSQNPPPWLGPENPEWPGNYLVEYWSPGWWEILSEYLDRVEAMGFDGFYLDKVDSYEAFEDSLPWAPDSMVALVLRIRKRYPGALVVIQNGEGLLEWEELLEAVDGVACEDLFYYDDEPVPQEESDRRIGLLQLALRAGKKVLVVDYPEEPAHIRELYSRARALGFVPYRTVRSLDSLVINPQDLP